MKVSAEDKEKTRIRLLEAAVDVITEKGFKSASMREIARRAEVGDATIYNYFPTKEKLLYGYCEHVQDLVKDELTSIENFHEYTLQEQLHQLVESELNAWLPAREFLQQVFELTYATPVAGHELLATTREKFTAMAVDLLDAAIEAGEIPDQPYKDLLPRLMWDYMSAILSYWLKDDSDEFANTTHLTDKSIEIAYQLLHSGLIGKAIDLLSFLFRTHVLKHLNSIDSIVHAPDLAKAKRRFMEGKE
ncbi:TetR family transcriptional regulator [Chromatiales bacterium (ex Bugula neritina AB1)]|nr:TetR family transcriptional regulator [Chromatiales bacterium (ex Bugula neritina AB1)]